jgi:CarboxypepD_reg-like domain
MPKNIQLRIPDPCSENWDQMRPEDAGRFCASCKKTVVDFTQMSDQQLRNWFSDSKGNICGRFHGDQLNRELLSPPKRKNSAWMVWHYLLAGLLISSEVRSQNKLPSPTVSICDSNAVVKIVVGKMMAPNDRQMATKNLPDTLNGRLIDSSHGYPIPFAKVQVSKKRGYMTDDNGYFAIPRKAMARQTTLTINAMGYQTILIDAFKTWKDESVKIIPLTCTGQLKGEVVVAGLVINRVTHSTILKDSLVFLGLTKKALKVYPNPVVRGESLTLELRLDEPGNYLLQLFNEAGMPMETIHVDRNKNSEKVLMPIPSSLGSGVYFVRLSGSSMKKVYTEQILVL